MKKHTFKFGNWNLKTYCRTAGHGWEVGFTWDGKTVFVGNFIHKTEATRWYGTMTREVSAFTKKYWAAHGTNATFYKRFLSTHLYKTYYTFLDRLFAKYQRTYTSAFSRGQKTYFRMKRNWDMDERFTARKTA